jgi:hypothetical protein
MKYIFLLFCTAFYGQTLHHEMLSAQGASITTVNGISVTQTIGQQTVTGTTTNGIVVQQGFQQNFWASLIDTNPSVNPLKITTYPNPFISSINFKFDNTLDQDITLKVYDIQGKLVFQARDRMVDGILTFDLSILSVNAYLARLSGTNLNFYTKIIKSL